MLAWYIPPLKRDRLMWIGVSLLVAFGHKAIVAGGIRTDCDELKEVLDAAYRARVYQNNAANNIPSTDPVVQTLAHLLDAGCVPARARAQHQYQLGVQLAQLGDSSAALAAFEAALAAARDQDEDVIRLAVDAGQTMLRLGMRLDTPLNRSAALHAWRGGADVVTSVGTVARDIGA